MPCVPLFIQPFGIGRGICDEIAIAAGERVLAIDDKFAIDTGREHEIRFCWMQPRRLRRPKIVTMAEYASVIIQVADRAIMEHTFRPAI